MVDFLSNLLVASPLKLWHCSDTKGLVTNYGEGRGLQNGRGGAREVLPLRKGGAGKVLAMLKGGTQSFGVVFRR